MKRGLKILYLLLIGISFVSAGTICGDNNCDAGQFLDGNKIEDASTCYEDCAFTDYEVCKIDSISGGTCNLRSKEYQITNVDWTGCGGMEGSGMDLTISSGEHSIDFQGIVPQNYINAIDGVQILVEIWPCAVYTTEKTIYFKTSVNPSELNDFVELNKENFNLKQDSIIEVTYDFPTQISKPYCKGELKNVDTQEIETMMAVAGCSQNPWNIQLESISAGKYIINSEYFDENAENKMGEKSIQLIVNECQNDAECDDENFFTKDKCIDSEIKTCSNKVNYTIIIISGLGIILIIILLFILFKRR